MNTPRETANVKYPVMAWWGMLFFTGGVSLLLNIWHAVSPPPVVGANEGVDAILRAFVVDNPFLGIVTGVVPVVVSAGLSHGLTSPLADRWSRLVILGLFVAAMGMSIAAQAALLRPFLGPVGCWVLPGMVDAAALVSLRLVIVGHRLNQAADIEADIEADKQVLRRELVPLLEGDIRRDIEADMAGTLATKIADIEADKERTLAAKVGDIRRDIERDMSLAIADKVRDMEAQAADAWEAQEAAIRTEFAERWKSEETEIRRGIEFDVRKEMALQGGEVGRRAIDAGKQSSRSMTSEDRKELVRQAIMKGGPISPQDLAVVIHATPRTARRLIEAARAEMGLASTGEADSETADGADMSSTMSRLRAV